MKKKNSCGSKVNFLALLPKNVDFHRSQSLSLYFSKLKLFIKILKPILVFDVDLKATALLSIMRYGFFKIFAPATSQNEWKQLPHVHCWSKARHSYKYFRDKL